jgi:hypothetical protein
LGGRAPSPSIPLPLLTLLPLRFSSWPTR